MTTALRTSRLLPVLLGGLLLLAGCSASDTSSDSTAAAPADAGMAAGSAGGAQDAATEAAPAGGKNAAPQGRLAPQPVVVRTGDLDVQVKEVAKAADEAGRLVRGAGGQVDADERSAGSGARDQGSAQLVLRIPPRTFDATLSRLSALGTETGRRLSSTNVTDQVVDLDSRLATQRASVARVRALLAEANTLGEVVQVEAELTKRTADLESLEARLQALQGTADLGTVTLRLTGLEQGVAAAGAPLGFFDGLSGGWAALRDIARVAAVTLGALLPFLPFVAVTVFLALRLRRRRPGALTPSATG